MPMIDVYLVSGWFHLSSGWPFNALHILLQNIYDIVNAMYYGILDKMPWTECVCATDDRNQKWIAGKR